MGWPGERCKAANRAFSVSASVSLRVVAGRRGVRSSEARRTVEDMKVTIIATNPASGEAVVVEADGADEQTATAAAKAQIPEGWKAVSIRRV
ncbi:hypothetical protein GCM10009857_14760 [Agromyces soli]